MDELYFHLMENRLIKFQDYLFYRCYKLFHKSNDDLADENANNFVTMLQILIIMDILFLIYFTTGYHFNINIWLVAMPLVFLLWYMNYHRYKKKLKRNNYVDLHNRWQHEKKSLKRIRGILIVLYVFLLLGFPIYVSLLIKGFKYYY